MNSPLRLRTLLFTIGSCLLLAVPPLQSASFTWDGGGGNTNFSTANNWTSDTQPAPGTSNTWTFTGSIGTTPQLDAVSGNSTWTTSAITFDTGAASFNIGPSNAQTTNRFVLSTGATVTQSSANAQTISATLLMPTGAGVTITGAGSGELTLGSLRMTGNSTVVLDRSVTIGDIQKSGGSSNTIRINPGSKTVTFSTASTPGLDALLINRDVGGGAGVAPTIQATNAGGFSSGAAVSSNDAIFGGAVSMSFTGNLTLLGSAAKNLTFNNTGGTTFSGTTLQFGAENLTGSRTVTLTTASNATATFSGNITGSVSSGTTSVTKSGLGTVIFSGSNTYNGTTTVSAGTLLINNANGSGTGSGAVLVTAGVLGGTGVIAPNNRDISIQGGVLAVGNLNDVSGTGIVDLAFQKAGGTANFSLDSDVTVRLDIWSSADYERLVFGSGANALDSINLAGATLQVDSNYSGWALNDSFTIIDWGGVTPTGTFSATLILPTLSGGLEWNTDSLYTTGVISVVPEPSVLGLFSAALLGLAFFGKRPAVLRKK